MKDLKPRDAEKIHALILLIGDAALLKEYEGVLKSQAEMRMGMYGQDASWHGTEVPEKMKTVLDRQFGIKKLYNQNLLSHDGSYIELRVLAGALPDKIITPYFKFDPEQQATEAGIDFEQFKKDLKAAFKGTVGQPGKADFGILLDQSVQNDFGAYSTVLGLGMLAHPYDKDTVDRLSKKGDLSASFKIAVAQGQEVFDKGIDAESVYLVTPKYSPLSVQVISEILNLPKPPQP